MGAVSVRSWGRASRVETVGRYGRHEREREREIMRLGSVVDLSAWKRKTEKWNVG